MDDRIEADPLTRRLALRVIGAGFASATLLAACKGESGGSETKTAQPPKKAAPPPSAGGALNCETLEPIDEKSRNMRRTLQYVEKSVTPGKMCSNCAQWEEKYPDSKCGGCKLFTGPVDPEGNCLSHAPLKS